MKRFRFLALIMAALILFGGSTACNEKNNPTGPNTPSDGEEEELPEFDDNGNRYVDLVTENESGELVYNGLDTFIKNYGDYPAFSDLHSDTPFVFADGKKAEDVIGIVHAGGRYNFSQQPYMTEGANLIRDDIGSRVIKLFLGSDINDQYSFNEEWGSYGSLAELVRSDEIKSVFRKDFSTIILVAYEFERAEWSTVSLKSPADFSAVTEEFYQLTLELIKSYNGSGKTFVLQNWEGDNELTPALKSVAKEHKNTVINNYLQYNNARQAGIEKARKELFENPENQGKYGGVEVLGALEVNYLSYNGGGESKVVDVVVPDSDADLFSFSDWSTANARLNEDLDYYLGKINEKRADGDKKTMNDIYLGEFGRAEYYSGTADEQSQFGVAMETAKIAVTKGVRYVCYWSLMCNERVGGETTRPANADMKGFWLIKPDGTLTKTFWYLKGLFDDKDFLSVQPKVIMRLPAPEEDPIPFVEEDILFFDNFDDVGLDGPDISRNRKMEAYSDGMTYDHVKDKDQPLLSRYFEKYNLTDEIGFTVVQKKHNNPEEEYIQYKVVRPADDAEGKFVMQGFIYDPTPKSMIKVVGTKNGTDYEPLKSVYLVDKTGDYGYLYVTTKIPVGYTSIRVLFTNTKAANSWDPLICRAAFLK